MLLQFIFLLGLIWIQGINAQGSTAITFSVDTGAGLVYFLLILFFAINIGTPFLQWVYTFYLTKLAEKASKELSKVSKRISDRMSDAGRKVSQSIRSI
jgi:hypothetical protein